MDHRLLKFALLVCLFGAAQASLAVTEAKLVQLRDITTIAGVRDNPLVGYGIVVGLNGTGDRQQTLFTTQTLANIMQRMGVQIPPVPVRVNNIAAVFVTASPAGVCAARHGARRDGFLYRRCQES